MRDTEEVSHLNSDRLKKLNAWKRDLKAHKAGEKFKEPYDGVRAYHEMSEMGKLRFDALSDVLEALTESTCAAQSRPMSLVWTHLSARG